MLSLNFYSTVIGTYIVAHTIGLGVCLNNHCYSTNKVSPTINHTGKYKGFVGITNHLVEQAHEVSPFLGKILRQLQVDKPINIDQKDIYGKTALHYAAQIKNPLFVTILLACGADVEAKDPSQRTALQIATATGNLSVVQRLLVMPTIQVNTQDQYAETALYIAAEKGHVALVELLLSHPKTMADLPNFLGKTAFTIAREKSLGCISTLQEKYNLIVHRISEKTDSRHYSI